MGRARSSQGTASDGVRAEAPAGGDARTGSSGPRAQQVESTDGAVAGDEAAPSFEAAAERLGAIVRELEGGELPLERSLELFEEGVRVARMAQRRLDAAERRVEELLGVDEEGEPLTRTLDQ